MTPGPMNAAVPPVAGPAGEVAPSVRLPVAVCARTGRSVVASAPGILFAQVAAAQVDRVPAAARPPLADVGRPALAAAAQVDQVPAAARPPLADVGRPALAALLVLGAACALRAGVHGWRRRPAVFRMRAAGPASFRSVHGADDHDASLTTRAARRLLVPPGWVGARLADTALAVDPAAVWAPWVCTSAAVTSWAVATAGAGAAALTAGMALGTPWLAWRMLRHRGAAAVEMALPAAVESVAAGLRSGASLRQALGEAAEATHGALGGDLAGVARATERGAGVVAALEGWAARRPLPGVRLVVAALCLSAETGGAAAQTVDAVAATLRQRLAAQGEARALATQARTSAAVMTAAPVAFCALSAALEPGLAAFLLRTPLGLALVSVGLGLDAAGALWMARLTRVTA